MTSKEHDHTFETLPSVRQVCFECDVSEADIKRVMRSLGSRGGRVRSEAKAAAARCNGAKGGRPRTKHFAPNFVQPNALAP